MGGALLCALVVLLPVAAAPTSARTAVTPSTLAGRSVHIYNAGADTFVSSFGDAASSTVTLATAGRSGGVSAGNLSTLQLVFVAAETGLTALEQGASRVPKD